MKSSMLAYTVVVHMMVSMKGHKALLLQNTLPHSTVDCMRVHKTEGNFVRKSCMGLREGRSVVMVAGPFLGNQGHNNESHILACKCGHTGDHRTLGVLAVCSSSLFSS